MKDRRDSGFTLVEVLVAFTILALVLIQLYNGLSQAVHSDLRSTFDLSGTRIARNQIERVGTEIEATKASSGIANGLSWSASVSPYVAQGGALRAFWVEVTVRDASHSLSLSTLKLNRSR